MVGEYIDHTPTPTCLRNHAFLEEVKAGRGPIHMVTMEAFQDPHLEVIGWENFLRNDSWSGCSMGFARY